MAVARHLGMKGAEIREALANFKGVNRRFTRVGEVGGVTIIDDYGHHPVEIRAVLAAARESVDADSGDGRVIAVVQPHRYTRLRDLMDDFQSCFNEADQVYVTPVYAAGEDPIEGVSSEALVAGLKSRGHRAAATVADEDDLAKTLAADIGAGDLVVCLGAGDITRWAAELAGRIDRERSA